MYSTKADESSVCLYYNPIRLLLFLGTLYIRSAMSKNSIFFGWYPAGLGGGGRAGYKDFVWVLSLGPIPVVWRSSRKVTSFLWRTWYLRLYFPV